MFELLEPLASMAACWTMGIVTGMGLGVALASQRFHQRMIEECE